MPRLGLPLMLFAACGSEGPPASDEGPAPVRIAVAPMAGGEALVQSATGRLLGFDAGRPVWVEDDGRLSRGDEASPLEFIALAEGDIAPVAPQAVVTSPEGPWLAAENGIYALEGRFLLTVDGAARPRWIAAGGGALGGLWWAEGERLVRWTADASDELDLARFGAAQSLSFAGDRGLIRIDDRFFELAEDDAGYTLRELTPTAPGLGAAVGHDGAWWVAFEGGLLRWDAGSDGPWRRHLLEGREVLDLASGADGGLWVQTDDGLLRLEAPYEAAVTRSEATADGLVPTYDGTIARLLQDGLQVWVDTTSPVVTFQTDVLPWLNENGCITCHSVSPADYANYDVFSALAAEALSRVQTGDMPRCGAGPCPPEEQLTPEEYAVLEAWIAGGRPQ